MAKEIRVFEAIQPYVRAGIPQVEWIDSAYQQWATGSLWVRRFSGFQRDR